jgi:hypothetical protein
MLGVDEIRAGEAPRQRVCLPWYSQGMHMVIHQAVTPDLDPVLAPILGQRPEAESAVIVIEEDLTAVVSTLGDMVRHTNRHDAGYPRHPEA